MNLYDFCLELETYGLLTKGVKAGAIPPNVAIWYQLLKDFKKEKSNPNFVKKEVVHTLSIKYNISYDWAYRIISKFS